MHLTIFSNAKINLFLNVIGRDFQGYHLIESYFARLKLADQIIFKPSKNISCVVENTKIDGVNIIHNTVKIVSDYMGRNLGIEAYVNKRIPIAAGLGGGSSNAAATLLALNKIYDLKLSDLELADLAIKIGADVSFFLQPYNAFVSGIGEIIKPYKLNLLMPVLLVNPGIKISAKEIYSLGVNQFSQSIEDNLTSEEITHQIYNGGNALEESAISLYPNLKDLLHLIKGQEGCISARMSGSGSTCFGLFSSEELAQKASNEIAKIYPTYWLYYELLEL